MLSHPSCNRILWTYDHTVPTQNELLKSCEQSCGFKYTAVPTNASACSHTNQIVYVKQQQNIKFKRNSFKNSPTELLHELGSDGRADILCRKAEPAAPATGTAFTVVFVVLHFAALRASAFATSCVLREHLLRNLREMRILNRTGLRLNTVRKTADIQIFVPVDIQIFGLRRKTIE